MSGRQFVPGTPTQGAMYHRLVAQIASTNQGLMGPNNVAWGSHSPMVGKSFQKPLSGATAAVPMVPQGNQHR